MEIINDAELLVNLSIRYKNNLIFTYVGPTLLVVNPFMGIPPLFTNDVKFNYIGKIAVKKGNHICYIQAAIIKIYRLMFTQLVLRPSGVSSKITRIKQSLSVENQEQEKQRTLNFV